MCGSLAFDGVSPNWLLQEAFMPYYSSFLVKTIDSPIVKRDKLRILVMLLSVDNFQALLREFVVSPSVTDDLLIFGSNSLLNRYTLKMRTIRLYQSP